MLVAGTCAVVLAGGLGQAPATADVPPPGENLAFNYLTDVSLFGGPKMRRGFGQVVCDASNQPSGCVQASGAAEGASPAVRCPASGTTNSVTDPDGAAARYGPAVIFGGQYIPGDQNYVSQPSGPLTSSITCNPGGSVTATTDQTLMPVGSPYPGGAGPGPFVADRVQSSCTANGTSSSGSVTITNGILETSYHTGDDPNTPQVEEPGDIKTSEPIPTNPTPGYTRTGTLDHVGDSYQIIFNEHTVVNGRRTVVAAHMRLLGPTAVGDMYVGSTTCGPSAPVKKRVADFDGDADTDRSVYRNGAWYAEGQPAGFLGTTGDIPVPGDYDGNGDSERAVYRNGAWYVEGQSTAFLGVGGDIPVPGDYDGDGITDRAVFRPSVGAWYVEGQTTVYHGATGDIPVPADYDGDGDTDRAIWRPNVGGWYVVGQTTVFQGLNGDIPVPGDYDGDGDADKGIWRPNVGGWYVAGQTTVFQGLNGDIPVPGDYDGDGDADKGIWRPSVGGWYVAGQITAFLGLNGDIPLPLPQAIYRAFFG